MTIDINEMRKDKRPQSSTVVHALLDRLEAAEKDITRKEEVIDLMGVVVKRLDAQCDAAERERDECNRRRLEAADHFAAQTALMKKKYDALRAALRHEADCVEAAKAEIEAMKKQEPVAWLHESRRDSDVVTSAKKHVWGKAAARSMAAYSIPLYALPGAQPAPSFADAYQGAMEEAAIWKKRALEAEDLNRKFIAEINGPTHMGEPAPSVLEDWPTEEMTTAFAHVFNVRDQSGTFTPAFRAALAAAPKPEGE